MLEFAAQEKKTQTEKEKNALVCVYGIARNGKNERNIKNNKSMLTSQTFAHWHIHSLRKQILALFCLRSLDTNDAHMMAHMVAKQERLQAASPSQADYNAFPAMKTSTTFVDFILFFRLRNPSATHFFQHTVVTNHYFSPRLCLHTMVFFLHANCFCLRIVFCLLWSHFLCDNRLQFNPCDSLLTLNISHSKWNNGRKWKEIPCMSSDWFMRIWLNEHVFHFHPHSA